MKWIGFLVIAAALLGGCGKKAETPGPAASAAASSNATAAAASAQKPLEGVVDPELTRMLKAFVQEKGRLPQDMAELKMAKMDSLPRPPAGFFYAIDPVTVEVKIVRE